MYEKRYNVSVAMFGVRSSREDRVSMVQCKSSDLQGNGRVAFGDAESLIPDSKLDTYLYKRFYVYSFEIGELGHTSTRKQERGNRRGYRPLNERVNLMSLDLDFISGKTSCPFSNIGT